MATLQHTLNALLEAGFASQSGNLHVTEFVGLIAVMWLKQVDNNRPTTADT